jgi:hypothetical protein
MHCQATKIPEVTQSLKTQQIGIAYLQDMYTFLFFGDTEV